jgi:glycerol kinase
MGQRAFWIFEYYIDMLQSGVIIFYRRAYEIEGVSVPYSGIAGDQQAALFGQTALNR